MTESEIQATLENIDSVIEQLEDLKATSSKGDSVQTDTAQFLIQAAKYRGFELVFSPSLLHAPDKDINLADLSLSDDIKEYKLRSMFFDTFVGTNPTFESRIDLSYLVTIPLAVLYECTGVVRRADYSMENGILTSVSVSKGSIVIPLILPSSGIVVASDIQTWLGRPTVWIMAPKTTIQYSSVETLDDERLSYFDSVLSDLSITPFITNAKYPSYTNPQCRYYDPLAGRPAKFKGHEIRYVDPDEAVSVPLVALV